MFIKLYIIEFQEYNCTIAKPNKPPVPTSLLQCSQSASLIGALLCSSIVNSVVHNIVKDRVSHITQSSTTAPKCKNIFFFGGVCTHPVLLLTGSVSTPGSALITLCW